MRHGLLCLAVVCSVLPQRLHATPTPPPGRVTILYDAFGSRDGLSRDWGFAALIEYGGKRILFDTGNNAEVFARNVRALGIDLRRLDLVVISHRHGDHTAGLNYLLQVNPRVKIYAPREGFGVFGAALPGTFYRRDASLPDSMRYFEATAPAELKFAWDGDRFDDLEDSRHAGTSRALAGDSNPGGAGRPGWLLPPGDRDHSGCYPRLGRSRSSHLWRVAHGHQSGYDHRADRDLAEGWVAGRSDCPGALHWGAGVRGVEATLWCPLCVCRLGDGNCPTLGPLGSADLLHRLLKERPV
jgi:hypothetical protein